MSATYPPPPGLKAFLPIWLGQCVSLVGTGMTRFAVTVWVYQTTGSAEALAVVGFFSFVPSIVMTPFAGAFVDRWNRKIVMIMSDIGAALATLVIFLLYYTDTLAVWHLAAAGALAGAFESFRFPPLARLSARLSRKSNMREPAA